jgi:uncharacterized protein
VEGCTVNGTPIDDTLFTWPDESPQLIGARCTNCGTVTFPQQSSCPKCAGTELSRHLLAREGVIWSWTIQGFRPKEPYIGPAEFTPYGVAYVDLGDVIVEGRLTEGDPSKLAIGMPVELEIVPFETEQAGTNWLTYAFSPTGPAPDQGGVA